MTDKNKRFGTFDGVFTPTFLSILGVIMYLRLGWVVGSVGLWGALAIITIANLITLFTCLSISSITTNINIGTGGAYSIISKSLGLEVGGAVGLPLYFSQAISVAFYVAGFSEIWMTLNPAHNHLLVTYGTWFILLIISYFSAKLAFRIQYFIILVVAVSLFSFFFGPNMQVTPGAVSGIAEGVEFWQIFAVFFPAVTGILAGVTMSGELRRPERNIPIGTLSAVAISFVIYILIAFRFAHVADRTELLSNMSVIISLAKWKWLIIAGIMGAIISSALSMFVTAPRTLLALSEHKLIPFYKQISFVNRKSEPVIAVLFTALVSLCTLLLGTLNNIAELLTMFFLATYGMLNFAVFIEETLGIVSFRPIFKIHPLFSFLGCLGCLFAMMLINPWFSLMAVVVMCATYTFFIHKNVRKNWPDVRKGIFIFIAENAMRIARSLPYHPKIWKPNVLVPISDPEEWTSNIDFIKDITIPSGRIDMFSVVPLAAGMLLSRRDKDREDIDSKIVKLEKQFADIAKVLREQGLLVSYSVVTGYSFLQGSTTVGKALKGSIFPPNLLFLKLGSTIFQDDDMKELIKRLGTDDMGVLLFHLHPEKKFGKKKKINLWLRDASPNINLAILIALKLVQNWQAELLLVQAVATEEEKKKGEKYLERIKGISRLGRDTKVYVAAGPFLKAAQEVPEADINIFGMSEEINMDNKRNILESIDTTILFLRDSSQENALV
ncbi:MAG: amino acid permease [Candidatus Omnitrophica bacterium]|nr:amino acid permease [Candidatus Omnitrophota bacterium]MDD5080694.1 amino acid permease [Candidatus Omnitrophota bacterium]